MALKTTKINDVTNPGESAPAPSSRPILVTNRPVLTNDPMMVGTQTSDGKPPEAQPMVRTGKTISPLTEQGTVSAEHVVAETVPESSPASTVAAPEATESTPEPSKRELEAKSNAAAAEADAAQLAREVELEKLIEDGTYMVPIDAVGRKRSHMYLMLFLVLAVILAVATLDVLADTGVVSLPSSIPHTHFFSTT
jgi:hypothetical protein